MSEKSRSEPTRTVEQSSNIVQELFRKTIGPLKESFVIYNSQGKSKGMAIVEFQRAADATAAKAKYNGKFVDGRRYYLISRRSFFITLCPGRPIRIEIISDEPVQTQAQQSRQPLSLFDRLGVAAAPSQPLQM